MTWPFKVDYDIMTGKTIFVDEADNEYIPTTTVTVSGERSDLAMVSFSYDYEQFAAQGDRKDITVLETPEYLPKGEVSMRQYRKKELFLFQDSILNVC